MAECDTSRTLWKISPQPSFAAHPTNQNEYTLLVPLLARRLLLSAVIARDLLVDGGHGDICMVLLLLLRLLRR